MTRRQMLANVTGSLALAPLSAGPAPSDRAGSRPGDQTKPHNLVIKGGRVIDPAQDLDATRDVAIREGKIAAVEPDIPAAGAGETIDARGKIVTPGLIDLHTHVFPNVGPYGIDPDPYCLGRGVTTVVDAGTSGALTFASFRHCTIDHAATRIRALLHVVSIGMVAGSTPNMGELEDLRYCVPEMAVKVAAENRDLIVGFKIRFSQQYTGSNDLEGMKRARLTADEAGLPLMIHIGGSYTRLEEFLALLKKGDVVTHSFNSHPHGLLDGAGKLLPEVIEARRRGVLFDVGHGAGSFSFAVMEKCLAQGFAPDTISSDLYTANIRGPVYDLPTTLAKFLLLGMSLPEVVKRSTVNGARVFNFGAEIGTLKPGAEADVSVFDLRDGEFTYIDSDRQTRTGRQKLQPVATVRGGKMFQPAYNR